MKYAVLMAVTAGLLGSGAFAKTPMVIATLGEGRVSTEAHGDHRKEALFEAGSIGKFACTIAALRLSDKGLFALDDPVATLLPELAETPIAKVTLRQLLQSRSGLADGLLPAFGRDPGAVMRTPDALSAARKYAAGDLAFKPGSAWSYDLVNWVVVQAILEAQTGDRIAAILEREVLKPAGMGQSRIFTMTIGEGAQKPTQAVRPMPVFLTCAGALATTPPDLIALARFPHHGGLSASSLLALQAVATPEEAYALGGRFQTVAGQWLSWQSGSNGAYKSLVTYDPSSDTGFAAMTATGDSAALDAARSAWLSKQKSDATPPRP